MRKSIKLDWTWADGSTTEVLFEKSELGGISATDLETGEDLQDEWDIKEIDVLIEEQYKNKNEKA